MNDNFLNEYSLRQLSIYELRNMARNMGVISPTSQKKDELVNKILNIYSGKEKPGIPKSRQGRPPKKTFENNVNSTYFEKTNYFNDLKYNFEIGNDKANCLLNSPDIFKNEFIYSEEMSNGFVEEERSGYYQTMKDGQGFVFEEGCVSNVDCAVLVKKYIEQKNNLKAGDYLKFICKKNIANNTRYLSELKEINGKDVDSNFEKESFEELKTFKKDDCVKYLFEDINLGKRYILDKNKFDEMSNRLKNGIKDKDIKVLNLVLDVLPEDVENAFNNNFENFYTQIGQGVKQNNFTIELFIDRAKRLIEFGFDVVLLVNSIEKLIKFKNFEEGYSIKDLKYKSFDNCYKILSLARKFEDKSITVFSQFTNKGDEYSKNVIEELENLEIIKL